MDLFRSGTMDDFISLIQSFDDGLSEVPALLASLIQDKYPADAPTTAESRRSIPTRCIGIMRSSSKTE
jgi:hypothetical protein